jgi:hypothetical protein
LCSRCVWLMAAVICVCPSVQVTLIYLLHSISHFAPFVKCYLALVLAMCYTYSDLRTVSEKGGDPPMTRARESKYVSVAEAREMLGVSEPRIAKMLKDGVLKWEKNPVDQRGKIILRADVEKLAEKVPDASKSGAAA